MAGTIPGTIWTLLQSVPLMSQLGTVTWVFRGMLITFSSAFIMGLVFSISAATGTDLARRPARFIAALTLGASCSLVMLWLSDALIPITVQWPLPQRILDWWLTLMLFGAAFGWAGVLFLQRLEDRNRLASLLVRHSQLSRQIAQSRLIAARARIDPEMLACILRAVSNRYHIDPPAAALLLDQLIAYLRLAMGKSGGQRPSLDTELALLRSYHSLRSSESVRRLALHVILDEQAPPQPATAPLPLFPIGKRLIDETLRHRSNHASLTVRIHKNQTSLVLETDAAAIPADRQATLLADLKELSADTAGLDILHFFSEPGVDRYVVQAAFR